MRAGRLFHRTLTVALGAVWLLSVRAARADAGTSAPDAGVAPAEKPQGSGGRGEAAGSAPATSRNENGTPKGQPSKPPAPAVPTGAGVSGKAEPKQAPAATVGGPAGEATVGQRRGEGQRKVEPAPGETNGAAAPEGTPESPPAPAAAKPSAKPKSAKAHQRGRAPRKPAATLPAGVARPEPNGAARRSIAGGPTRDDELNHPDDPELLALLAADRVLFPRPLAGVEPGWSWDLPEPEPGGPTLSASGVPPSARLEGAAARAPSVVDTAWLRSLALPDLPVRFDGRVVKYLEFYRDSASGRSIIRAWAKKAGRYAPALRDALGRAGLPRDLVWLSLIESGHNPEIMSPAGAAGLWQLVPETARLYGLVVDRWVDERLDAQRSTEAALRYLDDLRRRFGSWELAMAAYNMGHAGLARAIRKYSSNDYWELSRHEAGVPWETALYVPKVLAVALVMNNRKAFGIEDVTPDPPVELDAVLVGAGVSLSRVAAATEVSVAVLERLNPQLIASKTPVSAPGQRAKSYPVRVPRGKGVAASQRLAAGAGGAGELDSVLVRFGDTLASIARQRGLSEDKLRELNGLARGAEPQPDSVLLAPRVHAGSATPSAPEPMVVPATPFAYEDRERVFYRVLQGDSIDRVASAFGVSADELVVWNALDPRARLQSGMSLQIYVSKGTNLDRVCHLREGDARVLVIGSPEFIDHFEAQQGRKRIQVVAREGDTLRAIGNRYGLSVGSMERINRRSNRDLLAAGETVVVYAPTATPTTADPELPSPLAVAAPPNPELLPAAYEPPTPAP